jgi:hypothetical protein
VCKPKPGRPKVTKAAPKVSKRGEVTVAFQLAQPALLRFVVTHKWCGGPGCFSVVTTRTVPAAAGANRLVVHDLADALPPGRYRLEMWATGAARRLLSRVRLDVSPRKPLPRR